MTDDLIANKIGKRKSRRAKSATNKKMNRAERAERHSLSVYAGQNWLGSVEQRGDAFTAKTINGEKIEIFGNLKRAADAISDTAEAAV